ncbi:MAG TPA: type IV secretion system DNA-binding domain-containing protein, partial [Candidatus Andersenbacteria bacterium]|nr:type IV secretion system DNA-binding domain-containing protein [Candidatus Andersenbacteria bacterium]
ERRFLDHLEKQIYALYPEAAVVAADEYTIFQPDDTIRTGQVKLRRKEHVPIATFREMTVDPLLALTGALAKIRAGDAAVVQLVCRPAAGKVRRRGREAARRTVRGEQSDVERRSRLAEASAGFTKTRQQREKAEAKAAQLTPRAQERVELVEAKQTQEQFAVNIRLGVSARGAQEAEHIWQAVRGAFAQYDIPDLNGLVVRSVPRSQTFLRDLIFRVPRDRTAVTLGASELASLFHFPLPGTKTPNILWRGAKAAPAPPDLPADGVLLGHNRYRSIDTPVYFAPDDRRRHLYAIGQTGTGKTTLFLNMIVQDIRAGHGVGVIDPHGDLIEDILPHIPTERVDDVILFDPRDTERPLGFNILEVHDEGQRDLVVNEVVQILQKLAARLNPESIGPMFEHYLRNALLALTEHGGMTLLDVPRMFVDAAFRTQVLTRATDPTVQQFWQQEFQQSQRGQMSADMLSYVISKLGRFVGNRTMRNMIGQATSSFDVREVIDKQKILLGNLSKGSLGDINSDLLGFVLVAKLQIAALSRANVPEAKRPDFYLYLDEFQNFTTDSIVTILSEARKYRLNLNLTHQFVQQLDDAIREAVFGNVGTMVAYRVGAEDAESLVKQFEPVFGEYDLLNLERFAAVIRLLVAGTPQRAFSLSAAPPPTGGAAEMREAVRRHSRAAHGRPVAQVEQEILARFQYGKTDGGAAPPDKGDYLSESLFDIG